MVERVMEMAEAAQRHVERIAAVAASRGEDGSGALRAAAEGYSSSAIMAGIWHVRVHDFTEQRAALLALPAFVRVSLFHLLACVFSAVAGKF